MLQRESILNELPPNKPRPAGAALALQGIKVIDFSHFVAGPMATMVLGDLGADVIKLEPPGRGDEFRHYPPTDPQMEAQGAPYLWTNRNKRSVTLDLKNAQAMELVRRLIEQADVLVENFSTGVMERLGLGYAACAVLNPRLVYCSIPAYSRDGRFADRLGFDSIAQAESGFMANTGFGDREGVRSPSPVMDIGTGLMAGNAILAALVSRGRSGEGQYVEVALADSAMTMVGYSTMQHLYSGVAHKRTGNTSMENTPAGVFRTSDSSFIMNAGSTHIFKRLMGNVLERPDIAEDPRYAERDGRQASRDKLMQIVQDAFGSAPWSYWSPRLRAAGVPAGEVRTVGAALKSEEMRDRGLVSRIPHPTAGWVPNIAMPFRFSKTPVADPVAAPALGQHTTEVLREELGLDESAIASLRASGALG